MNGKLLGPKYEHALNNLMLNAVGEGTKGKGGAVRIGDSYTFSIIGEWQRDADGEAYYCEARRYIFSPTSKQYELDESGEPYLLYSPADFNEEPTDYSVGDNVRGQYNGNWEIVGATGGGVPTILGIVVEAIGLTPDVISDPVDYTYGKVKVIGDESGTLYDCACLSLAKDPNGTNHQQLIAGDDVILHGPYQRDNPDYDPENEGSNEPEKLTYYKADAIMEYRIKVDSDVQWDMEATPPTAGNSTITRTDANGDDVVMFVSGEVVSQGFKITGNAESYIVRNEKSEDGRRLFVVGGRCQQKVT